MKQASDTQCPASFLIMQKSMAESESVTPSMIKKASAACSTVAQCLQAGSFHFTELSLEYDAFLICMEASKLLHRESDEVDTVHVLSTTRELVEFKCS